MGDFPGLDEANVYGAQVSGSGGRAGCAAVLLNHRDAGTFDWSGLSTFLRQSLPGYAVSIFIRAIQGDVLAMATHSNKQNKALLRAEGVDPSKIGTKVPHGKLDILHWLPPSEGRYVPFGVRDWEG